MKLFSMDGKFLETFNKITDLVTLNILWLLCCIPIITISTLSGYPADCRKQRFIYHKRIF